MNILFLILNIFCCILYSLAGDHGFTFVMLIPTIGLFIAKKRSDKFNIFTQDVTALVILFTLFNSFIGYFIYSPNLFKFFKRRPEPNYKQVCSRRLSLIQSGVEKYNKSNPIPMKELDCVTLETENYITSQSRCPLTHDEYLGNELDIGGQVFCPFHGPNQWKTYAEGSKLDEYQKYMASTIVNNQNNKKFEKYEGDTESYKILGIKPPKSYTEIKHLRYILIAALTILLSAALFSLYKKPLKRNKLPTANPTLPKTDK